MSQSQSLSPEELPAAREIPASPPAEPAPKTLAQPLPDSPVERAILESQGKIPLRSELEDRSTQVAFGLLFVVPFLIIVLSLLLLFPFIYGQINREPDPSGVDTQSISKGQTPTR